MFSMTNTYQHILIIILINPFWQLQAVQLLSCKEVVKCVSATFASQYPSEQSLFIVLYIIWFKFNQSPIHVTCY